MSKISSKCEASSKSIQVDEELFKDFAVNNSSRSRNKTNRYYDVISCDDGGSPCPSDLMSENQAYAPIYQNNQD